MSRNPRVWKRLLHKQMENATYWRKIVVFEEGPSAFKVVQEYEINRMTPYEKMRASPSTLMSSLEWMYSSKGAAIEQAERCLKESEEDAWQLSSAAGLMV